MNKISPSNRNNNSKPCNSNSSSIQSNRSNNNSLKPGAHPHAHRQQKGGMEIILNSRGTLVGGGGGGPPPHQPQLFQNNEMSYYHNNHNGNCDARSVPSSISSTGTDTNSVNHKSSPSSTEVKPNEIPSPLAVSPPPAAQTSSSAAFPAITRNEINEPPNKKLKII
jgi:hypothetical protein